MPGILPFRALRFSETIDMATLTAPPYDAIEPGQDRELLGVPHNIAHLTLASPESAAATLRAWRADGTLVEDPEPALYLEVETFEHAGERRTREILHGLVPLDPRRGASPILFHERTWPAVVAMQEEVLEATGANLDSTLLLHDDADFPAPDLSALREAPVVLAFRDARGSEHRLHRCADRDAVAAVGAALEGIPLLIADGHHRMEAAMRFAAGAGGERPGAPLRMAGLVAATSGGLALLPTFRVIPAGEGAGVAAVRSLADEAGWPSREVPRDAVEDRLRADRAALLVAAAGEDRVLEVSCGGGARGAAAFVHERVLPALGDPVPEIRRSLPETLALLDGGGRSLALLLAAPTVGDVAVAADAGLPMPPKSTCFHPKLLSGLLIRALE